MTTERELAKREVEEALERASALILQLRARGCSPAKIEQEISRLALGGGIQEAIGLLREIHPTGPILDDWEPQR